MFTYRTRGTCSQQILLDIDENDIIRKLEFVGGCRGNTQGISRLVVGMKVDDVIERCKGILCQPTSVGLRYGPPRPVAYALFPGARVAPLPAAVAAVPLRSPRAVLSGPPRLAPSPGKTDSPEGLPARFAPSQARRGPEC